MASPPPATTTKRPPARSPPPTTKSEDAEQHRATNDPLVARSVRLSRDAPPAHHSPGAPVFRRAAAAAAVAPLGDAPALGAAAAETASGPASEASGESGSAPYVSTRLSVGAVSGASPSQWWAARGR